jgi:hypothetical protein
VPTGDHSIQTFVVTKGDDGWRDEDRLWVHGDEK